MIIYPAIDLKDGKCVRLIQGDFHQQTVYGETPELMAEKWEHEGASFLHLVDLDGACKGNSSNLQAIEKIIKAVNIPIQLGGGIRSEEDIDRLIEMGISRVILGTAAVINPDLVRNGVEKHKGKIAVGIDAKNGKAAVEGWLKVSELDALELGKNMEDIGVETIIYTDIARDGMLTGPNISEIKKMVDNLNLNIIASGGVSSLEDIKDIKAIGAKGVIVGKALYANKIELKQALKYEK